MDRRELATKVRDNFEALNRHDAAGCVQMLAPDCVLSDNGRPVSGREAIQALMQGYFNALPNLTLELLSLYVAGDTVLTEWRTADTRNGELGGIPARGTGNEPTGTGVEEFGPDGLVHRSTLYWDTAKLLRDSGIQQLQKQRSPT
jgi:steroid delta-isomerase-like uncharacterized protein